VQGHVGRAGSGGRRQRGCCGVVVRSVGWFGSQHPVIRRDAGGEALIHAVLETRDQRIRAHQDRDRADLPSRLVGQDGGGLQRIAVKRALPEQHGLRISADLQGGVWFTGERRSVGEDWQHQIFAADWFGENWGCKVTNGANSAANCAGLAPLRLAARNGCVTMDRLLLDYQGRAVYRPRYVYIHVSTKKRS